MNELKTVKKMILDLNSRRNLLERKIEKYKEVNVGYSDEMKEVLRLGDKIILLKEIEYRSLKEPKTDEVFKSLLSEYSKKVNDNEMVGVYQMKINDLTELKKELDNNLRRQV